MEASRQPRRHLCRGGSGPCALNIPCLVPYLKYVSAFHLYFTSAPSLPAWFWQFSISMHSLVVLSHFSTHIIHIIINIITHHLPVVAADTPVLVWGVDTPVLVWGVDTPVLVWGVEWQVFVSRDRGHWPARAPLLSSWGGSAHWSERHNNTSTLHNESGHR